MVNVLNVFHKTVKKSKDKLYANDWNDAHVGMLEPKDIDYTKQPTEPKEGDIYYDPSTKHLYVFVLE